MLSSTAAFTGALWGDANPDEQLNPSQMGWIASWGFRCHLSTWSHIACSAVRAGTTEALALRTEELMSKCYTPPAQREGLWGGQDTGH